MKKILIIILILLLVPLTIMGYINREEITADVKDALNIKPTQYNGMTVDMSQILPESNRYVTNSQGQDLIDQAAKLGMNTLRITNITSPTDQKITNHYTHQQWQEVLDKMRRKGIYAIILVESNSADTKFFSTEINNEYPNFVKQYVVDANLCTFSNILAVDIRNEPILDQHNLEKLRQASQIVKTACPALKVTIGSWKLGANWHDPKGAAVLKDIVDLYAVHIYGYDKKVNGSYPDPYTLATSYLHEIKKYSGNKPIIIEEFGAGNGSVLTDQNTLGSQDLQKKAYQGVLAAAHNMRNRGVIGAIGYLFLSRNDGQDGWTIAINNGDTLLPAAYTFQQYKN
jgi:hypothetical protein